MAADSIRPSPPITRPLVYIRKGGAMDGNGVEINGVYLIDGDSGQPLTLAPSEAVAAVIARINDLDIRAVH